MEAAFLFYGIPTTLIPEIKEKVYSQFKFIVNTPGWLFQIIKGIKWCLSFLGFNNKDNLDLNKRLTKKKIWKQ